MLRQLKIWDGRSVRNVSRNVCAKFRLTPVLHIKKALGIFRELITTTTIRITTVACWDPPSRSNKSMPLISSTYAWKSQTCRLTGTQSMIHIQSSIQHTTNYSFKRDFRMLHKHATCNKNIPKHTVVKSFTVSHYETATQIISTKF